MTNFYVTYTMPSKADRDGYLRDIQAEGIDEISRGEDGCIRYDYFYPVGSENTLRLGELKEKYGATTEIQIEDKV